MHTRRVNVEGDLNSMRRVSVRTNDAVTMAYSYRVLCDQMYYGIDCSRYCEDTDDETGHFTCDGEGNPVCLPGYNHSSANDSRCTQSIENCKCLVLKTEKKNRCLTSTLTKKGRLITRVQSKPCIQYNIRITQYVNEDLCLCFM